MLELHEIHAGYGDVRVLRSVSLTVGAGETVALVGANSAGKTTTLRTISGLVRPNAGEVRFEGQRLDRLDPARIVDAGIVQVPEGRRIFPSLSVRENLELGSFSPRSRRKRSDSLERVLHLFPVLKEKEKTLAGTLSGGQQQMLALGRALMALPRVLMLDEPSLGLAPIIVQSIYQKIREITAQGVTVLLVEQNVHLALSISQRGYVVENGRVVLTGTGEELLGNAELKRAYLGL